MHVAWSTSKNVAPESMQGFAEDAADVIPDYLVILMHAHSSSMSTVLYFTS